MDLREKTNELTKRKKERKNQTSKQTNTTRKPSEVRKTPSKKEDENKPCRVKETRVKIATSTSTLKARTRVTPLQTQLKEDVNEVQRGTCTSQTPTVIDGADGGAWCVDRMENNKRI